MPEPTVLISVTQPTVRITTESEQTIVQQVVSGGTIILQDAGIQGPPGPSSSPDVVSSFAYGDATPALLASLAAGSFLATSRVVIETPLNGAGATVSVGTLANPGLLVPSSGVMPGEAGVYDTASSLTVTAPTDIYLFISPGAGASAGAGTVFIAVS